eukprot:6280594-Pyramimonas_sp.AAC.1
MRRRRRRRSVPGGSRRHSTHLHALRATLPERARGRGLHDGVVACMLPGGLKRRPAPQQTAP